MTANSDERGPRRVTVLGATGSVGRPDARFDRGGAERYQVEALTAHRNVSLLAEQARQFRPKLAVIADPSLYGELKSALAGTGVEVAAGRDALCDAAARPSDWVMAAIIGAAGLAPTLTAVRRGAKVALANKECLVCAGELFTREVERHGAVLLPADSEHNAIFQVFDFDAVKAIDKIVLTASGGPFRTMEPEAMASVTPAQAVAHPNWNMGAKISVDSATMMNKGLELIEAYHLFPVEADRIEVLVHPQSIIHGMVCYADGSVLAHMGAPDMRVPIAWTLAWPERRAAPAARLDLAALGSLTFETPDSRRFPCLKLARDALKAGDGAATILNAANEVAVSAFLDGRIGFLDIARVVDSTLSRLPTRSLDSLDAVVALDEEARRAATVLL